MTHASILAAVAALLAPAAAIAGEAESADRPADRAIVVLGQSLPLPPGTPAYGAVVIDRARLDASASGRIEDVLRDVAGFSQFRRSDSRSANPSAQGANLRALGGNASSRTLVVLDGVPMADPFFGYQPFSAIVPGRLSLVRVTRGGGTGAFGAGAVAGIIEMASATRADLPQVSASALYGSRNATEIEASVSPDVGAGYVSLSGRWDRGDGFYTTPASQRVAASVPAAYRSWSLGARAVAPVGADAELQARFLVYRDDRILRFSGATSHSEGQDASVRLIARGDWQVDALAYLQARNFANVVISSTSFRKTLDQRNTPALGYGGKIELRPPVGADHLLRFGLDARGGNGDMDEVAYNAGLASNPATAMRHATGRQFTTGAFVEDDWTLGDLVLTAGGRVDHWTITGGRYDSRALSSNLLASTTFPDRSGWEAGGRAGILWHASDAVAVRAAAYTGFRLPTLNELYRPFVVFPVTTQANAALDPERLKGAEIGIDLTPVPGFDLGVTLFDNRLDGAITNVTIATNTRQRRNVRAIEARGVELTGSARIGDVRLSASYVYSDARVDSPGTALDGLLPAQAARHAASATLAYAPRSGPLLSTTLRYAGAQFEDDLNSDVLPEALTVDASASVPLGRGLSIVGRVENLFDERVVTRNAGGSMDLGVPQTFWLGIKFTG